MLAVDMQKIKKLQLINRDWNVKVQFNYREVNRPADFLARKGARQSQHLVMVNTPCKQLQKLFDRDVVGQLSRDI